MEPKSTLAGASEKMRLTKADLVAPGLSGDRVKRCPSEDPATENQID